MVSTRRVVQAVLGGVLALLAAAALPATVRADTGEDLAARQERQKQIQADTEHMVRRVATMLRVLEYYQLDKKDEQKLLHEVAATLSGLSRKQMNQVLARLDAAARAPDATKSEEELKKAYEHHREVVTTLKGLLSRYDAVKNLDQAAERLDKLAATQLELHLLGSQLVREAEVRPAVPKGPRKPPEQPFTVKDAIQQADDQMDLKQEAVVLFKQLADLKASLPPEEKERLQRAEASPEFKRVINWLSEASWKLRALGDPSRRDQSWKLASEFQWRAIGYLRDLARSLRTPLDELTALREARARLDLAIQQQETLRQETEVAKAMPELLKIKAAQPDPKATKEVEPKAMKEPAPKTTKTPEPKVTKEAAPKTTKKPEPKTKKELQGPPAPTADAAQPKPLQLLSPEHPVAKLVRELGDKQVRLQQDAREAQQLLQPHAKELAAKLQPVEPVMKDAQNALRDFLPHRAVQPQADALKTLQEVRKDLDHRIAEAEKKQIDPLAALQDAAQAVEQLLKEQKETRDTTKWATKTKFLQRLAKTADPQQALAKRTEAVKEQPLPDKARIEAALDKAAKAMTDAAKALKDKQGAEAVAKQEHAIKALEEAKKHLADQMADIAQRREDIAKLEDAGQKLDELAKEQGKVADEAKAMTKKPGTPDRKNLAKKQGELTPQAKDLGKQLASTAPDAAQKVDDGAKHMDMAKGAMDRSKTEPAAKQADAAAKKLMDAQKDVAKALAQLKGKEIAAQAAMQAGKVDPASAAQQLAKALEETNKAVDQSKKAVESAQRPQPKGAEKTAKAHAMDKSHKATDAAMQALGQAQAQAPHAVQPLLKDAGQKLAQAAQQLGKDQPGQANQAQVHAAAQLSKALAALNAAAAMAKTDAPPGPATAKAGAPNETPGQAGPPAPGAQPGQGTSKTAAKSQEKNEGKGDGERQADGTANNAKAQLAAVRGDGTFLHLPARQRELIRQALTAPLPPEYAGLIQQYYINIARGRPAAAPAMPPNR